MPLGALRVLARRSGREILVLHGDDRPIKRGEVLHHVSWWPSTEVAAAVSRFCATMLESAKAPAGPDGWHVFDAAHVDKLVQVAKNHLNADLRPEAIETGPRPWTRERIARLGFLAGLGWTAKRIADDPLILSTPNNVYRQAFRFGISLTDGPQGQVIVRRLPVGTLGVIDRCAAAARQTRDAFVRHFLITAADDPNGSGMATLR